VLPRSDACLVRPLHDAANQRMYKVLTVKTPGCVAFSLPVQRRNLRIFGVSSVFPTLHSQRSARLTGAAVSSPSGVRSQVTILFQGRLQTRQNRLLGRRARYAMAGERLGAAPGLQRQTRRRLLPPKCSDGPTLDAPDCVADHDPRKKRADAERKLRASFCSAAIAAGGAPRVAFWPSPHPRIRWTVASPGCAIRARRHTRPPPSRVPKCPTKC
jgi:hypothetical protein